MLFTFILFVFLIKYSECSNSNSWYIGCYHGDLDVTIDTLQEDDVVVCARYCHMNGYGYIGMKGDNCVCLDDNEPHKALTRNDTACTKRCIGSGAIELPCGGHGKAWSFYHSAGPYITHLNTTVQSNWIVSGQPVVIDTYIQLANLVNISEDVSSYQWLKTINVSWNINSKTFTTNITQYDHWIRARLQHTFKQPGLISIEVTARNHISTWTATANITVIDPAPKDLDIVLLPPAPLVPSCLPADHNFKSPANTTQPLVVFRGQLVKFEVTVSVGTNLSFVIAYGDTANIVSESANVTDTQCDGNQGDCSALLQEHVFEEKGVFLLQTTVTNEYGQQSKNISVVVMEPYIGDAEFVLEQKNNVFETGEAIKFLVSLETTVRRSTVMQIDFGNHDQREVSLREYKNSNKSLPRNHHLDLLHLNASYGEGCNLTIEFQYRYDKQGIFAPSVMFNNQTELLTMLDGKVTVMNRLMMPKIQASKSTLVNTSCEFSLQFLRSSFNMSILWTIVDSQHRIIDQNEASSPHFFYTFTEVGIFVVHANASNEINSVSTSFHILVQVPISDIALSCTPRKYVWLGSHISCTAVILHGTNASFTWDFDDRHRINGFKKTGFESITNHTYYKPGIYSITVTASNAVSQRRKVFDSDISVEIPIQQVVLIHGSPTLLGHPTHFIASTHHRTTMDNSMDVKFEFDVGDGRKTYPGIAQLGEYSVNWTFEEAGVYDVAVFASNNVSDVNTTVLVYIEEDVDAVHVDIMSPSVQYLNSIFVLTLKGQVSMRRDVIYKWQFDHSKNYLTRSPVIGTKYTTSGFHDVNYTVYNQVASDTGQLEFKIEESLSTVKVIHSAIEAIRKEVTFRLVGFQDFEKIFVDYIQENGDKSSYSYTTYSWKHTFYAVGVYQLAFSIFGYQGSRTSVRSYINVEEPITDLYLTGPSIVEIKRREVENAVGNLSSSHDLIGLWHEHMTEGKLPKYGNMLAGKAGMESLYRTEAKSYDLVTMTGYSLHDDKVWEAVTSKGSHLLYSWSINGNIQNETTVNKLFHSFEFPDTYDIHVRAWNDISESKASMIVKVQYPVIDLEVSSSYGIVGIPTNFSLQIHGGGKLFIDSNFGDGYHVNLSSKSPMATVRTISTGDGGNSFPEFEILLSHVYMNPGRFLVKFNVSNLVSHVIEEIVINVEEAITGIELWTTSPSVISLTNPEVMVTATVQTGQDLMFKWDFGDLEDEFTSVTSEGNTSKATHSYNLAQEYSVRVLVSNPRYPYPVIATLPTAFAIIEEVEHVSLVHQTNNSEFENGAAMYIKNSFSSTNEVTFIARVGKGSNMRFIFDFGDGTVDDQIYLEYMTFPMMQFIKTKHRYKNVGVYDVKLTISNQLGNVTVRLSGSFYVQIPPQDVAILGTKCALPREVLNLQVTVGMGTNYTIDWKLGDETEIIKQGKSILHTYQTIGTKLVQVIVQNKVHREIVTEQIDIVNKIHGVSLKIPSEVIVAGESYQYKATPRPNIDGIVEYYKWDVNETVPRGAVYTKHPTKNFSLPSGKHLITVKAENCFGGDFSPPVYIHSVARLVDLTIVSKSNKLVGKPVQFQAKFWDGDSLNFTWNFGDGTKEVVVHQVTVDHTYQRTGEYIVSLTATNPVSSMSTTYRVFILTQICDPPDVHVVGNVRGTKQLKFLRSDIIHIEANVKIKECQLSSVVFYSWKIISQKTRHQIFPKYLDEQALRRQSLILMPRMLEYGNYTIQLKVKMNQTIVYTPTETEIHIGPSPLKAVIDGGSLRRLNHKSDLLLNASLSTDPDRLEHSDFKYKWSCAILNTQNDSCFNNSFWPPEILYNVSVVSLPTKFLLNHKNEFVFNLTIKAPSGREASADQVIKILRVDKVLDLKLKCKQCTEHLVNPNYQVSFETSCPECDPTQTTYKWELKMSSPAVQNFEQCVQPDGSSYVTFLAQKLDTTTKPEKMSSQSTSPTRKQFVTTTSQPLIGPWMMKEGQSSRGRGRGEMPKMRNSGGRGSVSLPENIRGSDLDVNKRIGSRKRNLPTRHRHNDNVRIPLEGSPGESGSSQGRISGNGVSYTDPVEQPGHRRQFPDDSSHVDTTTPEDTLLGNQRLKYKTMHIFSQDWSTILLLPEQTRTGLTKQSLVINPGVLIQGRTYVVKVTAHTVGNISGEAMTYFKVNESPQKGLCEVSSSKSGIEVETIFRVFCREWKDEHQPLQFEVSYNLYKGDMKKLLYRGLSHDINFQLPAGNVTDGNRVYLYIGILDSVKAQTSVCPIAVTVHPKPDGKEKDVLNRHSNELEKSVQQGDSRTACVLIDYLAKQLNKFTHQQTTSHVQYRQTTRLDLLNLLSAFPKRDEFEILQVAQSLVSTTAVPSELQKTSLFKALEVLQTLRDQTEALYENQNVAIPDLLTLAVRAVSNIMEAVLQFSTNENNPGLKLVTDKALGVVNSLVKLELEHHSIGEKPIYRMAEFVSVMATHFSTGQYQNININEASFTIPPNINIESSTNQQCYQAHMTTFKRNPYGYGTKESLKVQSQVVSLNIYNCEGQQSPLSNFDNENQVVIKIPTITTHIVNESLSEHVLKRNDMNIHQFNVSRENMESSLYITLDLNVVKHGRLFPISILIGQHTAPTPDNYYYKEDFKEHADKIKLFLHSGILNATGMYYIGIVDVGYNSRRRRPGELMERLYKLVVWWGGCLYWDVPTEKWSSHGCTITKQSDINSTNCRCNHLTAFGGHIDLVPNDLSFTNVEDFFRFNENPFVIILVVFVFCLYSLGMVLCSKADIHDMRKSGSILLKDNHPTDKHMYEITVETGYRQGSGTSAKISFILHGEEGMSETRELISEDERVLFESNSRDVFIMSVPDTLGRLWKVQLWHNNNGDSPSWYLSRVIIKDLSNGKMYYFLCEKWFAVEEDDGKIEREIMVLDSNLGFSRVFWAKGVQYLADYHLWLSPYTCPSYSRFSRIERLTCCLTVLMSYMCLNAVWYRSKKEYRGEFELLDLSLRNIVVGEIITCIILPVNLFIAFLFRRSKIRYPGPEPDKVYVSGKQNGEQISETDEEAVQPVMTYSILDQSILNWQGLQDWAQKQWIKRQQSVRSHDRNVKSRPDTQNRPLTVESERDPTNSLTTEMTSTSNNQQHLPDSTCIHPPIDTPQVDAGRSSHSPQSSPPSPHHHPQPPPCFWNLGQGPPYSPRYLPACQQPHATSRNATTNHDVPVQHVPVVHNIRRGYETDLASSGFVDATSQSQATAERTRVKLVSETSSSSRQSNTEYIDTGRGWRLFLPYWCRYLAWFLCITISLTCAVITILYGVRFGYSKSIQWIQSLYFTFMICVNITQPLLILIVVLYTAVCYRNNPAILNHHDDGYYGIKYDPRKITEEIKSDCLDPREELERGVAERQRSRYLRFVRPPNEKTLIEARKKTLREKLAYKVFRSSVLQVLLVLCVGIIAYGKSTNSAYQLNTALSNIFLKSGNQTFNYIKSIPDFYSWCQTTLLDNVYDIKSPPSSPEGRYGLRNSILIGSANLRQLRVKNEQCLSKFAFPVRVFPGVYECKYSYTQYHKSMSAYGPNHSWTWQPSQGGITLWGKYGHYDNSGFVTELNESKDIGVKQIKYLKDFKWIDDETRAVIIELTLYYIPGNLFSCMSLLVELPASGGIHVKSFISSTHLFRYVSTWDTFILAFELVFFVISLHKLKCELVSIVIQRKKYFTHFWSVIELCICMLSLVYLGCYVYRYMLVSEIVNQLRDTYYQQFINITFIACWNELLQSLIGTILFLLCIKLVRLLNQNSQCRKLLNVYKQSRKELYLFVFVFFVLVMAFSSAGVALFGTASEGVKGLWSSVFTMTMMLTGVYPELDINQSDWTHVFILAYLIFASCLLTAFIIRILNTNIKQEKLVVDPLQMTGPECVCFLWQKLLIKLGIHENQQTDEPENILPAEFIMAEIEYQVDELLFRMNALSGSSALPDKPRTYFTDSDTTHNIGDDGISSGGSENHDHGEGDRLGQRVQRIEDKLYANEPYLAQLLKLDSVGADILSQEKEKQLRSHLELEIFRQLQLQRQEVNETADGQLLLMTTDISSPNTEQSNNTSTADSGNLLDKTWIPTDLTGLENLFTLREALPKSSSSSPDSTHDTRSSKRRYLNSEQIQKCIKAALMEAKKKQSSSSENVSPQSSESDKAHAQTDSSSGQSSNTGSLTKSGQQSSDSGKEKSKGSNSNPSNKSDKPVKQESSGLQPRPTASSIMTQTVPKIKPAIPPKPNFMKKLSELKQTKPSGTGSPKASQKTHLAPQSSSRDGSGVNLLESSSGSEQDGSQSLKRTSGRRALRKTKSQGRGKGHLLELDADVFGEEEEQEIDDET